MDDMWLQDLTLLARTLVTGVVGYAGIVLMLRISGKRTLSKMNMFDFIVTVAFGSTLATMLLSTDTSIVRGFTAFAVLIALQYMVTFLTVRSDAFSNIIKAEPRLLFSEGTYLDKAMREERVNRSELHAAARHSSVGSMQGIAAMVLETDGTISVIPKADAGGSEIVPQPKE